MLFIPETKQLYFYRNMRSYLYAKNDKDKKKGNLIFLTGNSLDENKKLINNPLIVSKFINSYYVDYFHSIKLSNGIKRKRLKLSPLYREIKESCFYVRYCKRNLSEYKGLNLYFDLSVVNDLFFNNIPLTTGYLRKLELYKTAILPYLKKEEFNEFYQHKYFFVKHNLNYNREILTKRSFFDFFSFCMLYSFLKPEEFAENFKGFTFIVMKNKSFIKLEAEDFNKMGLVKFFMLSKKFDLKDLQDIEIKDDEEIEDDERLEDETKEKSKEESTKEEIIEKDKKDSPITKTEKIIDSIKDKFNISKEVIGSSLTGQDIKIDLEERLEKIIQEKELDDNKESLNNEEIEEDEELLKVITELKKNDMIESPSTKISKLRNAKLKEALGNVSINKNEEKIGDLLANLKAKELDKENLALNDLRNVELKETTSFSNFEKTYNQKQDLNDKVAVLHSFSDDTKSIPLYVRDIKKKESNDQFNLKDTWTIQFEDAERTRHSLTFDVPTFLDNKFLYINGNKKVIDNQLILLPIVKIKPEEVKLTSNYNVCFLNRFGKNLSVLTDKLVKIINLLLAEKYKGISAETGNSSFINSFYPTTIEYDIFAENFISLDFNNYSFKFNQEDANNLLSNKDKIPSNCIPIGKYNEKIIYLDYKTNYIHGTEIQLSSYIRSIFKEDPKILALINEIKTSSKFAYSRLSVLNQKVPLVLFLGFKDGLNAVLRKANIKYEILDKQRRLDTEEKEETGSIKFKNAVLYFDRYPLRNSLLLDGFSAINTEDYNIEDLESKDTYLEIFNDIYGTRTIGKGFDNFLELFLDPITIDILKDHDLPTNITEFYLYANMLLEDNAHSEENDMTNYRVRSNEIINAEMYKMVAQAYVNYKNNRGSGVVKVSVPKDELVKRVLDIPLVEDYSTLNPIKEMESRGNVTYKGPSGLNTRLIF